MSEQQEKLFVPAEPPAWKPRSVQWLERAAQLLDEKGHTAAPIAMYSADYHRVRRHLGIKRGKVMWGEHQILNGGPRYKRKVEDIIKHVEKAVANGSDM